MDRLNYQHLFYFWNVVREGSVTGASEKLKLAQPTISGQLTTFESAIGAQLLKKQGRRLILTETGRIVFNYAEEIFSLGFELTSTLKAQGGTHGRRLSVGISDALPKLIVYRLIEPVLETFKDTVVVCREDRTDRLLAELALHGIDLLISDGPATSSVGIRIHNHFLGESDVGIFGAPSLVAQFSNDFPKSLEGAPFLLPTQNTALRRSLDSWFNSRHIRPAIRAEIEDSALLKTFAAAGLGFFAAPISVAREIQQQYRIEQIGVLDGVAERFYAISVRRRVDNPAALAILERASALLKSEASLGR